MGREEEVISKYPGLTYDKATGTFTGYVDIGFGDRYYLEIDSRIFPKFFPTVFETNERIPRNEDRHCFEKDGSLCFTTLPLEEILLRTKIRSLVGFVDEILIPFLENNSYFEIKGEYRFGTFAHGKRLSLVQTYRQLLGVEDLPTIVDTLIELKKGRKYQPNESCFCRSGKKIKKCNGHLDSYQSVRLLSRKTVDDGIESLKDYMLHEAGPIVAPAVITT